MGADRVVYTGISSDLWDLELPDKAFLDDIYGAPLSNRGAFLLNNR